MFFTCKFLRKAGADSLWFSLENIFISRKDSWNQKMCEAFGGFEIFQKLFHFEISSKGFWGMRFQDIPSRNIFLNLRKILSSPSCSRSSLCEATTHQAEHQQLRKEKTLMKSVRSGIILEILSLQSLYTKTQEVDGLGGNMVKKKVLSLFNVASPYCRPFCIRGCHLIPKLIVANQQPLHTHKNQISKHPNGQFLEILWKKNTFASSWS